MRFRPRHYFLSAFGSHGDVLPLAVIGSSLVARGHRVTFAAGWTFSNLIRQSGMEFVPTSGEQAHARSLEDVPLLATRYQGLFLQRHAVDWNQAAWRAIRRLASPELVLLSAERPFHWADLLAHIELRTPLLRCMVDLPPAPGVPLTPSLLPAGRVQRTLEVRWQEAWRSAANPGDGGRGPGHVGRLMRRTAGRIPRLGLWPEWIVGNSFRRPNQANFGFIVPPPARVGSGVSADRPGPGRIAFVAGSSGTTRHWSGAFLHSSLEACRRLGRPGLFLGGEPASQPLPDWFRQEKFLPLPAALAGAAAIVHHGGVGTAAIALHAGVPQLIVPRLFSQPSNAEWFRRLGVAEVLAPDEYRADSAAHRIHRLIQEPSYAEKSRACRARIRPEFDLAKVCDAIENFASLPGLGATSPSRPGSSDGREPAQPVAPGRLFTP